MSPFAPDSPDSPSAPDQQAALERLARVDLPGVGVVQFMGEDATKYLQGQLTNDVKQLEVGQGQWTALCNHKGRMVADLVLIRLADRYLGLCSRARAEALAIDLEKRHFAEKLEIAEASTQWAAVGVEGPEAAAMLTTLGALELPADPYAHRPAELGGTLAIIIKWSLLSPNGFTLLAPASAKDKLVPALTQRGAKPVGGAVAETARILMKRPWMDLDMDESTLLPETGYAETLVSYSKGCYLGQEAIARIRTYGGIKKKLGVIRVAGEAAPPPGEMSSDGAKAGLLASSARHPKLGTTALAYLREGFDTPGREFDFEIEGAAGRWHAAVTV